MSTIRFQGSYLDGRSTDVQDLNVFWDGKKLWSTDEKYPFSAEVYTLDPPLGNTLRVFRLPDGAVIQTSDLEAIRGLEQHLQLSPWMLKVNRMEQHWPWVYLALILTCLCFWLGYRYMLPVLAHRAAQITTVTIRQSLDDQTLRILEREYFEPTHLPLRTQQRLQVKFKKLAAEMDSTGRYQLRFLSDGYAANAFALPGGTVVMTDELVNVAENDREILAVLAHEVGHVIHQHGLRRMYQDLGVSLMLAYALGDVSSITNVATTLPATLINSGYSRAFEREADQVAGTHLIAVGWGTRPLRDILDRIAHEAEGSLLSSHPGTKERIAFLKNLETSSAKQISGEQIPQNGAKEK